jgi:pimeloyl-ACP methyl ester carboxylesterase
LGPELEIENAPSSGRDMPLTKIGGVRFYYEVHGSGEPLLLIAGLGSDSSSWGWVVNAFSAKFKTIVFDNLGAGRSGTGRTPCTIRRMARDAVKLLDRLGVERAHIIGHSMGGYIAGEIAVNYPERVNRLVLANTAAVSSERNNFLFRRFLNGLRRKGDLEGWIRDWTFWLFSPKTFENGKFVEKFIGMAARYPYPISASGFKAQAGAVAGFDIRSRLRKIKARTLIITGEEDILIRPSESAALAGRIRGGVLRTIKGAAHCIQIEKPALFTKAAEGFLAAWD